MQIVKHSVRNEFDSSTRRKVEHFSRPSKDKDITFIIIPQLPNQVNDTITFSLQFI